MTLFLLDAAQGEASAVRYLFKKGLEANMRSRYIYLSWGLWEKAQGLPDNARRLFRRGAELNPQDAPLLQVGPGHSAPFLNSCP